MDNKSNQNHIYETWNEFRGRIGGEQVPSQKKRFLRLRDTIIQYKNRYADMMRLDDVSLRRTCRYLDGTSKPFYELDIPLGLKDDRKIVLTPYQESMTKEIGSFYEKPTEAIELLSKKLRRNQFGLVKIMDYSIGELLFLERHAYLSRLDKNTPHKSFILEDTLRNNGCGQSFPRKGRPPLLAEIEGDF